MIKAAKTVTEIKNPVLQQVQISFFAGNWAKSRQMAKEFLHKREFPENTKMLNSILVKSSLSSFAFLVAIGMSLLIVATSLYFLVIK